MIMDHGDQYVFVLRSYETINIISRFCCCNPMSAVKN